MALYMYNVSSGTETPLVITYSNIDKKSWVYQPNFTRWRHRSRGVRESLKINQEMTQTYYDLYVLLRRIGVLDANFEYVVDTMEDGGDIDGLEYNWGEDATPSIGSVVLEGVEYLGAKIEELRKRIAVLEG